MAATAATFSSISSASLSSRLSCPSSPASSSFASTPVCRVAPRVVASAGLRTSPSPLQDGPGHSAFCMGDRSAYQRLTAVSAVSTSSSSTQHGGAISAEMNLFVRVGRIFRAFVSNVISNNEDPERLLDQAVEEMGGDLAKLRQTSAQVVAAQRMLQDKYSRAQATSEEWYRRARLALDKGDEPLAKEALKRRKAFDDSARSLKGQLDQQTGVADRIISSSRALESKISEARSKKDQLKARAQSAKTSKQIQEMLGSIDTSSALAAYERMEEKVQRLEAEADALTQITSDDLTSQFAALEAADVGDDLDKLKQELGMAKSRAELPAWQDRVVDRQGEKVFNYPGQY